MIMYFCIQVTQKSSAEEGYHNAGAALRVHLY